MKFSYDDFDLSDVRTYPLKSRASKAQAEGFGRPAGAAGVVGGLGAHVIKTGLGPILIDLMERGFVSAIATNGAAVIHDFEIALCGATSEDVDESLGPGRFGMAEETAVLLNDAIRRGSESGHGLGQAVASLLAERKPPFSDSSIAIAAHRLNIPITVHVA